MTDVVYLALILVSFAVLVGLVRACERIAGRADAVSPGAERAVGR